MEASRDIQGLIQIMAALRAPRTGCPWDLEQTHKSLAPYALEEAYETVDAIERGDMDDLRDELGDLLLQVVFHARIAEEANQFSFEDIVEGITSKMVRRHPHVFSDAAKPKPAKSGVDKIWDAMRARRAELDGGGDPEEEQSPHHGLVSAMRAAQDKVAFSNATWEQIKEEERLARGAGARNGFFADVSSALPGLSRAVKLQMRASTVGFDWNNARQVLAKLREEIDEIDRALEQENTEQLADEIGDLAFAVANLARHAKVDPETAVRAANSKFERRFAFIEEKLAERGSSPKNESLEALEALWGQAKAAGL